jgi:hypothetical protein
MSSFNITDVTIAGAYVNAIAAAEESARRTSKRRSSSSEGPSRLKSLSTLVRRVAAALSERRPDALRLASRRV